MDQKGADRAGASRQAAALPVMAGLFLALTAFLVVVLAGAGPGPARGAWQ